MRLLLFLTVLFFLTACMDTLEVPSSTEEKSSKQILINKTDAQEARDEYKKLQEERENN